MRVRRGVLVCFAVGALSLVGFAAARLDRSGEQQPEFIGLLSDLGFLQSGSSDIDVRRKLLWVVSDIDAHGLGLSVMPAEPAAPITAVLLTRNGVPATPFGLAVDSDTDRVYVSATDQAALWILRSSTREVLEVIDLPPDSERAEVFVNPSTGVVYLSKESERPVVIVKTLLPPGDNGRITLLQVFEASSPGPQIRFHLNPKTNLIYVSGGPTLPVIDGNASSSTFNSVVAILPIPAGILLVNPRRNLLYIFSEGGAGSWDEIESVTRVLDVDPTHPTFHQIVQTVPIGPTPFQQGNGIFRLNGNIFDNPVLNPTTERIYIRLDTGHTHDWDEFLIVLDAASLRIVSEFRDPGIDIPWPSIDLYRGIANTGNGAAPRLMIDPTTSRLFVANQIYEDTINDALPTAPGTGAVTVASSQATVTFASVTGSGTTSVEPLTLVPKVPTGFAIEGAQAYDVSTTASVTGPFTVCFNASHVISPTAFAELRVLHGENGVFVDRTSSHDFATGTICATASSLSPFIVARKTAPPPFGVKALYDENRGVRPGATIPIKLQLLDGTGANVSSSSLGVTATGIAFVGSTNTLAAPDAGYANPDVNFRYDAALNGYIYNLSTRSLATGAYRLSFTTTGDSIVHTVGFVVGR